VLLKQAMPCKEICMKFFKFLQSTIMLMNILAIGNAQIAVTAPQVESHGVDPAFGKDPQGHTIIRLASSASSCSVVKITSMVRNSVVLAAFNGMPGKKRDGEKDFKGKYTLKMGESIYAKYDSGEPNSEYWIYVENSNSTKMLDAAQLVSIESFKQNVPCQYDYTYIDYGSLNMKKSTGK
jgi:hypothetical protein